MEHVEISRFWRLADPLKVKEAAALIAGHDPGTVSTGCEYFKDPETGWTYSDDIGGVRAAYAALQNAIRHGNLNARVEHDAKARSMAGVDNLADPWECVEGGRITLCDVDTGKVYDVATEPNWDETTIERAALVQWLSAAGIEPEFFFPKLDGASAREKAPASNSELQTELDQARARIAELEHERAALQRELSAIKTAEGVDKINSKTLGLILELVGAYPAWRAQQKRDPQLSAVLAWAESELKKSGNTRIAYAAHHVVAEHYGLRR